MQIFLYFIWNFHFSPSVPYFPPSRVKCNLTSIVYLLFILRVFSIKTTHFPIVARFPMADGGQTNYTEWEEEERARNSEKRTFRLTYDIMENKGKLHGYDVNQYIIHTSENICTATDVMADCILWLAFYVNITSANIAVTFQIRYFRIRPAPNYRPMKISIAMRIFRRRASAPSLKRIKHNVLIMEKKNVD